MAVNFTKLKELMVYQVADLLHWLDKVFVLFHEGITNEILTPSYNQTGTSHKTQANTAILSPAD